MIERPRFSPPLAKRRAALAGFLLASALTAAPAPPPASEAAPDLYDRVARALLDTYYDESFRETELPELIARHRPTAAQANRSSTLEATWALLEEIPISHLGLLSEYSHARLFDELLGTPRPSFGFEVVDLPEGHFVTNVYEGGPAERAGLRRWDRIVGIDGRLPAASDRLEWRTDDAHLDDPPLHYPRVRSDDDRLELAIATGVYGDQRIVTIEAEPWSALQSARASARVVERDDVRIGVLHFWFIHIQGVPELLDAFREGECARCDALVLDLRGRGGNAMAVEPILAAAGRWSPRPVLALTDRHSRSAKDVIAFELKERGLATLVGERTAGAVIPASFREVGDGMVLMLPTFTLGRYTEILEGNGVEPDVTVEAPMPDAPGADPILERGLEEALRRVEASRRGESLL